jgi:hypothetical protein
VTIANWTTIGLAIFGVLGAAVLYSFQRNVDRKETLRAEKKRAYREFLDALFEHAEKRTEATRYAYDKSKIALLLVAPDAVMKELVGVQETAIMDMSATCLGDVHITVSRLIFEMRRDCFEKSKLVPSPLCQGSCPLLYFSSISQVGGIGR